MWFAWADSVIRVKLTPQHLRADLRPVVRVDVAADKNLPGSVRRMPHSKVFVQ